MVIIDVGCSHRWGSKGSSAKGEHGLSYLAESIYYEDEPNLLSTRARGATSNKTKGESRHSMPPLGVRPTLVNFFSSFFYLGELVMVNFRSGPAGDAPFVQNIVHLV